MARILIVEDHFETNRAIRKLCESAGHETVGVFSGEAGLSALVNESPGLVILDHLLPGIEGLEVLRRIRDDDATRLIPVVMYSDVATPIL